MRNLFFHTVARHAALLVVLLLTSLVVVPTVAQPDTLSHNDRRRYQYFFLRPCANKTLATMPLRSTCCRIASPSILMPPRPTIFRPCFIQSSTITTSP